MLHLPIILATMPALFAQRNANDRSQPMNSLGQLLASYKPIDFIGNDQTLGTDGPPSALILSSRAKTTPKTMSRLPASGTVMANNITETVLMNTTIPTLTTPIVSLIPEIVTLANGNVTIASTQSTASFRSVETTPFFIPTTTDAPNGYDLLNQDAIYNPQTVQSCSECYTFGTDTCQPMADNLTLFGDYRCNCKSKWRGFTCRVSPDFCTPSPCLNGASCLSLVDHFECICKAPYKGATCHFNAAVLDGNNTEQMSAFSAVTKSTIIMTTGTIAVMLSQCISMVRMKSHVKGEFDPQSVYQFARNFCMAMVNMIWSNHRHPAMIASIASGNQPDPTIARFWFWVSTGLWTTAALFWLNEAVHVDSVMRLLNYNKWQVDMNDRRRWMFDVVPRLLLPFVCAFTLIGLLIAFNWSSAYRPWTGLGTFDADAAGLWIPLTLLQIGIMVLSVCYAEGALIIRNQDNFRVKRDFVYNRNHWEDRALLLDPVYRNGPFVVIGPMMHLFCWFITTLITDMQNASLAIVVIVASTLYSVFMGIQASFVQPNTFQKISHILMCYAPAGFAPSFDHVTHMSRDETVAKLQPARYRKELLKRQTKLEHENQAMMEAIERSNEKILQSNRKTGTNQLIQHIPIKGPALSYPPPFPFPMEHPNYIPLKIRERICQQWTERYCAFRLADRKREVKMAIWDIRKTDIDEKRTDFMKREYRSLFATWRYQILRDDKFQPIYFDRDFERKLQEGLSPLPADVPTLPPKIHLIRPDHSNCMRPIVLQKAMPILHDYQLTPLMTAWQQKIKAMAAVWDAGYLDDDTFGANVKDPLTPSENSADQPLSWNPGRNPLDEFWLNPAMPGFIGPKSRLDLPGPAMTKDKECAMFFKNLLDQEWHSMAHEARYTAYKLENPLGLVTSVNLAWKTSNKSDRARIAMDMPDSR